MSKSLSDLKKSRGNVERLQKKLADEQTNKSYQDDRFWYPQRDKVGNATAVIRFLPAHRDDNLAWTRVYSHGFQNNGKWFIENCPTTIGGECPVCAANSEHWATGLDSRKQIASARKRQLRYISNILVISDPQNPENNGKVFLFKFGVKIFEKIESKLNPEFADEEAANVFCFWEGCNFKLRIRGKGRDTNYDKSEFDSQSLMTDAACMEKLADDDARDAKIEEIWGLQVSLVEFTEPDQFKSKEELGKLFARVDTGAPAPMEAADNEEADADATAEAEAAASTPTAEEGVGDEEVKSSLEFFQDLSKEVVADK